MKKMYITLIMVIVGCSQITASVPSSGEYKRAQLAQVMQDCAGLNSHLTKIQLIFEQQGILKTQKGKEFKVVSNLIMKMTGSILDGCNGNVGDMKNVLKLNIRAVQLSNAICVDLGVDFIGSTKK